MSGRPRRDLGALGRRATLALLAPAALVFVTLLVVPMAFVVRISLLPSMPAAPLAGPLGLGAYAELADPYHIGILWRTVRIAGITDLPP